MATIHRAIDLRLDRAVAVKLLRPEAARDADLASRFRREALAATVLRHPNIVACLDTGTDRDQPYLVMDLVDGEDLSARLKRGGRLSPSVGGPDRARRRPRPRRGPRARDRPSRRQARQHPARRRRSRDGHRLRDRAAGCRRRGGQARHHARVGPLLQPGTGARRHDDAGIRRLRPRAGPVRGADRDARVRGRDDRRDRAGQDRCRGAVAQGHPSRGPGRARCGRPASPRARPGRPVPQRQRDGRGARSGRAGSRRREPDDDRRDPEARR